MRINDAGLSLIKSFESLRLSAYQDEGGVWTIGYGSTDHVRPGMRITLNAALDLLEYKLEQCEEHVERCLSVPVSENEFSALVSICYNIGNAAFERSTLLRLLNLGEKQLAALEFLRWVRIKGKKSNGLYKRRKAEMALFLKV